MAGAAAGTLLGAPLAAPAISSAVSGTPGASDTSPLLPEPSGSSATPRSPQPSRPSAHGCSRAAHAWCASVSTLGQSIGSGFGRQSPRRLWGQTLSGAVRARLGGLADKPRRDQRVPERPGRALRAADHWCRPSRHPPALPAGPSAPHPRWRAVRMPATCVAWCAGASKPLTHCAWLRSADRPARSQPAPGAWASTPARPAPGATRSKALSRRRPRARPPAAAACR